MFLAFSVVVVSFQKRTGMLFKIILPFSLQTCNLFLFLSQRCVAKRSVANITYSKRVENKSDVLPVDITQNDDIITCDMCCHGDFCNSHGCGSKRMQLYICYL